MRWDFVSPPALVDLNDSVGVNWIPLVGIDRDAKQAGVGLVTFGNSSPIRANIPIDFCISNLYN